MGLKARLFVAKISSKVVSQLSKIGPGQGKNIPGYVFSKIGGRQSVVDVASELKLGSVLITGTNGKTTTTTLLIKLISKDVQIRKSFENNTVHSIITAMLNQKGDLGIFEYGIRNLEYGIPDVVQKVIDPIGVVYTTISEEHTVVNGVKNPFLSYYHAKELLSKEMTDGVIVTNCDDPRTALIGIKRSDIPVNYYGIATDKIVDLFGSQIKCPKCGETLDYSVNFLNHRGIYSCICGFKRPEPNVKLDNIEFNEDNWKLHIVGDVFNYFASKNVQFEVDLVVPPFGYHNIYNVLSSTTAYVTFTPKLDNIEKNIVDVFNNLDMSFVPPGRFEVIKFGNKNIGIGQGDNGDAISINVNLMSQHVDGDLEFIYTTPDENEEDIFNKHYDVIKKINPKHIIVLPGRKSVEKAEEYCNIIKNDFDSVDFYPISYGNLDERIDKITDLAKNSEYENIIVSGCGEELAFWENVKRNFD